MNRYDRLKQAQKEKESASGSGSDEAKKQAWTDKAPELEENTVESKRKYNTIMTKQAKMQKSYVTAEFNEYY